jgi:hypothetical protein
MGELRKTEGPFTLRGYADLVAASIDRVGGAVVLVGHSMGAQIVELAAVQPVSQSVLGLLLLSPVPLAGAHAPDPVAGALAATGGDVNAQREARRSLMAQPADTKVLEWLTGLGRNVSRDVTEQLVAAWDEGVAEGRGPSAFDGPVLVASGDADPFVTTQMSIDVAGRFRNCSRVALKDCGHWPQAEHPELVAKLVSDFIVSVSSKPGAGKVEDGWTHAFGDRSESSFGEAFAPSVVLEASVLTRRVEGRKRVQTILGVASRLYEALDFTRRAKDGDRTYQEWEARLHGGERVAGVTVLTTDASGKITAIAIHHRPLPGVLRFSAELRRDLAGKIEPDLFHDTRPAAST